MLEKPLHSPYNVGGVQRILGLEPKNNVKYMIASISKTLSYRPSCVIMSVIKTITCDYKKMYNYSQSNTGRHLTVFTDAQIAGIEELLARLAVNQVANYFLICRKLCLQIGKLQCAFVSRYKQYTSQQTQDTPNHRGVRDISVLE